MSSWICDGIPKDGKEYPGLGGAHEPRENYSFDCECGLPKGSHEHGKTILIENSSKKKYILGVVALGIILLAGGSIAFLVLTRYTSVHLGLVTGARWSAPTSLCEGETLESW